MAEDLTDHLLEMGIQVRYLPFGGLALRRVELLLSDVLSASTCSARAWDLPEVSLVAVLDADEVPAVKPQPD